MLHFSHLIASGLFVINSMSSFSKEMEGLEVVDSESWDTLVSDKTVARLWVGVNVSVRGRA